MLRAFVFLFFLGVTSLACFAYWVYGTYRGPAGKEPGHQIIYQVETGTSLLSISQDLEQKKILKDAGFFYYLGRALGVSESLKAGVYLLKSSMSIQDIFTALQSGKSLNFQFTIPEGFNVFEIANLLEKNQLVSAQDFLQSCFDQKLIIDILGQNLTSCEGYLFPETYSVELGTKADKLITIMMRQFLKEWDEIKNKNRFPLSRHQLVTLASIVEKETGVPYERPLISSVFHNRLRKGMRLQTDPTVLYALMDETKIWPKNIRKIDLSLKNRYNTYWVKGLPYGPIANPGHLALIASMEPDDSDYLYFVSRNDGTHLFSKDYQGHVNAVREYQLNRANREGKSWRDFHKKER